MTAFKPFLTRIVRYTARLAAILGLVVLAGCATNVVYAPDEAVAAARYRHGGATELQLVTVMNYRSGRGDHTGLFVNGSERVLFDPAGSWYSTTAPEQNDVHFGMTPSVSASYLGMHTRETHYTVVQRLRVSPEVAERAMALVRQAGPVPPARCALSTSAVLSQLDGLSGIPRQWYPHNLMADFARLPGVETVELRHDDPDLRAKIAALQRSL